MYFKEEDIIEELICPNCQLKFINPRILPCGKTCCQACIQEFMEDDGITGFKCSFCETYHCAPTGSFLCNQVVANLIKKSPFKVSRGENCNKLNESLQKILSKCINLEEMNKRFDPSVDNYQESFSFLINFCFQCSRPIEIVREHCSKLRNQVDLDTETTILAIQNKREELLEKIDEYERKCAENIEKNNNIIDENQNLINKTKAFLAEW